AHLQHVGVLLQQLVGHVGHRALGGGGLAGVLQARESTIWLFHRGMVFTREDWIFSSIRVSLFWIRRVWGPIWMEIMRVSSRSWSFFSNREIMLARSLY